MSYNGVKCDSGFNVLDFCNSAVFYSQIPNPHHHVKVGGENLLKVSVCHKNNANKVEPSGKIFCYYDGI